MTNILPLVHLNPLIIELGIIVVLEQFAEDYANAFRRSENQTKFGNDLIVIQYNINPSSEDENQSNRRELRNFGYRQCRSLVI